MAADWGSIADWAAAVGTITASVTALSIAFMDRRERKRERDDAELAHARLVVITIETPRGPGGYAARVQNFGDRSVRNVEFVTATVDGLPEARLLPSTTGNEPTAVLQPERGQAIFFVTFDDTQGESVLGTAVEEVDDPGHFRFPGAPDTSRVRVTVRYTDPNGVQWTRTGDETPVRVRA